MRRPTTLTGVATLTTLLAVASCDSAGTETDNPLGPEGVELRRSSQPYVAEVSVPAVDADALRDANRDFALALYGDVAARSVADENVFLGTHSVATVLTMTLAGARGDTETELMTALQLSLPQDAIHPAMNALAQQLRAATANNAVRYDAVNSLWLASDHATEEPFLGVLSQHYDAGVFLVDFENDAERARRSINSWVSDETEGLIPELFGAGQVDATTELVLTNAAYLSAPWQDRFDPARTTPADFTLADGNVVEVPLMDRVWEYPFAMSLDWRALELPFRDSNLSLVFVMPWPGGTLAELEVSFDGARVSEIVDALDQSREDPPMVWAAVPRFDFSSSVDLRPSLEALGMVSAFDEVAADFTGIDPSGDLYVDSFVHRTTVGVDEYGTTAAAATGEVMVPMPITPSLHFTRPFLFFTYDHDTGSVLFVGRLVRPAGEAHPPAEPAVAMTSAERICGVLAGPMCDQRTTTEAECLSALAADDATVLDECARCSQLAEDARWGGPVSIGDPCDPATCADRCPSHPY